jgi:uncharacterized protein (TIGR03435 family)
MNRLFVVGLVLAAPVAAQTFDAASVKLVAAPAGAIGEAKLPASGSLMPRPASSGPGSPDPGRIRYPQISLKNLMRRAYGEYFEIRGPGWMDNTFVSVEATMPPDTNKEQLATMFRNLIVERFSLSFHVESTEAGGYVLTAAKNGPRLKPAANTPAIQDAATAAPLRGRQPIGPDGFPVPRFRAGGFLIQSQPGDRARMVGQAKTVEEFAEELGRQMRTKVVDATGLTDKYDIILTYAGTLAGPKLSPSPDDSAADPLPDIFRAIETQLGLKLEPKKIPVRVMVVDRMEKEPREN